MADKSLRVRYIADVKDLLTGLQKAADSQKTFGQRIDALKPALIGLGVALSATAGLVAKLGMDHERAQVMIRTAIENSGRSWDAYRPKVEEAIKQQERFGHNAGDTQEALARLTVALGNPDQALKALGAAAGLAALKHISLTEAAVQLAKAAGGNSRALKELGINTASLGPTLDVAQKAVDKARQKVNELGDSEMKTAAQRERYAKAVQDLHDKEQILNEARERAGKVIDAVRDKTRNLAENESVTLMGRLKEVKAKVEDAAASFGQKYGPALLGIGAVITTIEPLIGALGPAISAMAGIAGQAFSALFGLFASNPWLLAIVGLAAVVALIVTHWTTVKNFLKKTWDEIKSVASTVWNALYGFFKTILPLIVAVVLGPVGVLALEVAKHWHEIQQVASQVWGAILGFLKTTWNSISSTVRTTINTVKTTVLSVWNTISSTTSQIWNTISSTVSRMINTVKTTVSSTINTISSTWNTTWNAMKQTVQDVINHVVGIVQWLKDRLSEIIGTIGDIFSKLAFWRHSPSQLEVNAELSTKGAIQAFEAMRARMLAAMAPLEAPLLGGGPVVTVPTVRVPAPAPGGAIRESLHEEITRLIAAIAKTETRVYLDGKEIAVAVRRHEDYMARARS